MNDPFRNEGNFFAPNDSSVPINWSRLDPGEAGACVAIGERIHPLLVDHARGNPHTWVPTPTWIGADIACSHMQRSLDLHRIMHADPADLLTFYLAIAGSINRSNGAIANNNASAIVRFQKAS